MKINIGDKVTTEYYENEVFKVVGVREKEVELLGDWSGGTNNVSQVSWYPTDKCTIKECARFFFTQDGDCHWYTIPVEKRDLFNELNNMDTDSDGWQERWDKAGFDSYRTGGGIHNGRRDT